MCYSASLSLCPRRSFCRYTADGAAERPEGKQAADYYVRLQLHRNDTTKMYKTVNKKNHVKNLSETNVEMY